MRTRADPCLRLAERRSDRAAKAKARRWIKQGYADAAHARLRIRLWRDLANAALDVNGGRQLQAHRKRQIHLQRDGKIRSDVDDGLSDIGPRHGNDSLSG